jgi:hypothetical protein
MAKGNNGYRIEQFVRQPQPVEPSKETTGVNGLVQQGQSKLPAIFEGDNVDRLVKRVSKQPPAISRWSNFQWSKEEASGL